MSLRNGSSGGGSFGSGGSNAKIRREPFEGLKPAERVPVVVPRNTTLTSWSNFYGPVEEPAEGFPALFAVLREGATT